MKQSLFILFLILFISCNNNNETIRSEKNTVDSLALFVNYEKPTGKTFKVSDVELPSSLLITDTAKNIFENKIGEEIMYFPYDQNNYGLVNYPNNGLIQTIQECYDC